MLKSSCILSSSWFLGSIIIHESTMLCRCQILMLNKRHQLAMEMSHALASILPVLMLKLILEMVKHAFGWMYWMVEGMSSWSLFPFLKIQRSGRCIFLACIFFLAQGDAFGLVCSPFIRLMLYKRRK